MPTPKKIEKNITIFKPKSIKDWTLEILQLSWQQVEYIHNNIWKFSKKNYFFQWKKKNYNEHNRKIYS